jgi:hypothetical protein
MSQEISFPSSVIAKQQKVPEVLIYSILLHQAAAFKDKEDEMDRKGVDGSVFRRHIGTEFGLSNQQVIMLYSVALQYRDQVKDSENKLRASVERFRERNAQLPKGAHVLPPPSEAVGLTASRDALILLARDRFHSMVGDLDFSRIDANVKMRIGHNVTRRNVPLNGDAHEN